MSLKITKVALFKDICDLISNRMGRIYCESQVLPFSGSKTAQTKVVTTGCVGYHIQDRLKDEICDLIRGIKEIK